MNLEKLNDFDQQIEPRNEHTLAEDEQYYSRMLLITQSYIHTKLAN